MTETQIQLAKIPIKLYRRCKGDDAGQITQHIPVVTRGVSLCTGRSESSGRCGEATLPKQTCLIARLTRFRGRIHRIEHTTFHEKALQMVNPVEIF